MHIKSLKQEKTSRDLKTYLVVQIQSGLCRRYHNPRRRQCKHFNWREHGLTSTLS